MYGWQNNWEPIIDDYPSVAAPDELHNEYDQMMHDQQVHACMFQRIEVDQIVLQLDFQLLQFLDLHI